MDYKRKYNKYKKKYMILRTRLESSIIDAEDTRPLESKISSNNVEISIIKKRVNEYEPYMFTNKLSRNIMQILKIDNIETFDKFTNKYTEIKNDTLKINWEKLSEDFKGIYIVNEPQLRLKRYTKASKNGQTYKSWWTNGLDEIDDDIVIEFDRTESTENDEEDPRLPLDPIKIEENMDEQDIDYINTN